MDRLKYKLFSWLWCIWHMRLRGFFDRFAPPCSGCVETMQTYQELAALDYPPAIRGLKTFRCYHAKYVITSRPWWHVCCNGDSGGWRTHVCDWLEHKWRSTETYNNG